VGAQDGPVKPPFPPSYPYLLRLERREPYTTTCALLKRDGSFHYERIHSADRVTVLEGELPPDELAKVAALLQHADLVKLTQDDILEPLLPFGEELQVNVFRRDHWQDLVFPDSKDRKKLVPTVDSLVDWLGTLPRLPHREMTEFEGRNNCLTDRPIELRSRPLPPPVMLPPDIHVSIPRTLDADLGSTGDAAPPPSPDFLLRMTVDRVGNPMQRQCAVIYPDGRYHAETSSQSSGESMHSQVMEGVLPPPELDALRQILDAPEWRVEYNEQAPPGIVVRGGEFVRIQIPGPHQILHSVFANLDFTPIPGSSAEAQNNDLAAIPGSHLKLLAPLRTWFKQDVEDAKLPPIKDVPATNCKPRN
jgi:hypothetical protein